MESKLNFIIDIFAKFCDTEIISSIDFPLLIQDIYQNTLSEKATKQLLNLKNVPRTGWVMKNIPAPENVAEHTISTVLIAMDIFNNGYFSYLDKNKTIKQCLIHDIAESICGDIVALDTSSKNEKYKKETKAVKKIFKEDSQNIYLWHDFENKKSNEAIFVKELDKLQMIYKAHYYEKKHHLDLSEFKKINTDYFILMKDIFDFMITLT